MAEIKVLWTKSAQKDLKNIYDFNIPIWGEEKSYKIIDALIRKVDILEAGNTAIGSKYESKRNPKIEYRKLVEKNCILIYRVKGKTVYINRVFDTRQDPKKLKL